ncbi:MAG: aldo/keto reductase [Clostridia bacterium]|nr:aldo/keto reductase [Clostridia bacterium]
MIYKKFKDANISALGLGCMRFPKADGEGAVDLEATERLIDLAIEKGINYFDTAWVYHDGHSEEIVGRFLGKYPRESYYLATKFPGFSEEMFGTAREKFETQLARCATDYFDFYLFHNVSDGNVDNYLNDEKYGDYSYFVEQKRLGRIRYLGFSTHGSLETIRRFLDAYGENLDFCQIQLNWLDWELQNAKAKVELLKQYGIPVWVMEPLRGGRLASLDSELAAMLPADQTPARLAFRFLQTIPEVTVVLSGMSSPEQIEENALIFSEDAPLNRAQWSALQAVAERMMSKNTLHCTACRYCTSGCPSSLDIPEIIKLYNRYRFTGKPVPADSIVEGRDPSACIGCGACEGVCPQNIKISEMMADFAQYIK